MHKKILTIGTVAVIFATTSVPSFGFGNFSFGNTTNEETKPKPTVDYPVEEIIDSTVDNAGQNYPTGSTEHVEDIQKNYTIQINLDRQQQTPVYIETGLIYEKKLNWKQVKEIVDLIVLKSNGKTLEDAGKIVSLIDGTLIEMPAKEYTVDEFANLFKGTKVEILKKESILEE